ncbi:MAG TPA: hypothetical protein V6D07_14590 [Trichocoleus sp.]
MNGLAFNQPNESQKPSSGATCQPWLQDSVRTFFETLAWEGQPAIPVLSNVGSANSSAESPMTMQVSSFFSSIPWDGQPIIAAPVAPLELQVELGTSNDTLTLDAFSDLF